MQSSKHILPLDGLRGVAALMVVVHHCLSVPGPSLAARFVNQASVCGWIGVDLFFVLSGFLITGILLDTREHANYFKSFYIRRALRIFPLYYATLVVFLVIAPAIFNAVAPGGHHARRFQELCADQAWYWTYMSNWLYVKLNAWPSAGHLSHFWSLAIEEQFYLVWPFLVWISSRRALALVCVAGCIAGPLSRWMFVWSGTSWVPPYVATVARIDLLCIGALIAIAWRSNVRSWLVPTKTWATLAVGGMIVLGGLHWWKAFLEPSETSMIWQRHLATGGVFGAMLVSCVSSIPGGAWYRLWTCRPLVWCGTYSYGIYVLHWPVFHILRQVNLEWCHPAVRPWVFLAACLIPTFLAAVISMAVLERPFLKLKRFWSYESEPRREASVSRTPLPTMESTAKSLSANSADC